MSAVIDTLETVRSITQTGYKWGFETDIEMEFAPKGLNEGIIRLISARKNEPGWLLAWRLEAFAGWKRMEEPHWARVDHPPIDYQDLHYFAAPKRRKGPGSLDEVDPELLRTYEKLGVPLKEQAILAGVEPGESNVAVDAVFDSISVATTFRATLARAGVLFCPISEAVRDYPDLVQAAPGKRGATRRQFLRRTQQRRVHRRQFRLRAQKRALPDGAVHLFPHQCAQYRPVRADADHCRGRQPCQLFGGLHRPMRDESQLHAAVVELVAMDDATIKYSTVQNWYPGDAEGRGGIYNFVTKRGACRGARSKISWTQVETGSAITWSIRPACYRAKPAWVSSTPWP